MHTFIFGRVDDFLTRYSLVRAERLGVTAPLTRSCGKPYRALAAVADASVRVPCHICQHVLRILICLKGMKSRYPFPSKMVLKVCHDDTCLCQIEAQFWCDLLRFALIHVCGYLSDMVLYTTPLQSM